MQGLLVSLIVAVAAVYAAWQLMPQSGRRWLIGRMGNIAPSRRAWIARLESEAEKGGCSSCKGCASDGNAPPPPRHAKIEVHRRIVD